MKATENKECREGNYLETLLIVGVIGLFVIIVLFGKTSAFLRLIGHVFVKIAIGAILLFLLNVIGSNFDIHVPINLVTATVSGFLGIPGVLALTIIDIWIV